MTVKSFTDADVNDFGRIYADRSELVVDEPDWMKRGLQQTATGYGGKLNTGLKISYNGRIYRLYCTCYSNNGVVWFKVKGRRIVVA
jgi:hypothetical protein